MAVRLAFTGNLAESIHRHLGPDPPARIEVAFFLRDKVVAIGTDPVVRDAMSGVRLCMPMNAPQPRGDALLV
jgi:hypothetical protein